MVLMNILVTGGTGLIGTYLKSFLPLAKYVSSKDYNLFLFLIILLDKIIIFIMKNNPKIIFPIGYVFSAKKK